MLCPVCKAPLSPINYKKLEIDFCCGCKGVWCDKGELLELLGKLVRKDSDISPEYFKQEVHNVEKKKNCPRCGILMRAEAWQYGDATAILDFCLKCRGVWADKGEVFWLVHENMRAAGLMKELAEATFKETAQIKEWKEVEAFASKLAESPLEKGKKFFRPNDIAHSQQGKLAPGSSQAHIIRYRSINWRILT